MIGEPSAARDYVFATDIAEALVALDECDAAKLPASLNVGSGRATTLQELADTLAEVVAPRALQIKQQPARGFDVERTWLSVELAESALAWTPRWNLRDGLAETWASLQG
jgi:UDP-glucose 4-epimerase